MKNKGFTLVELMSVIVLIALISLITVPIILGVIGNNDKKALESSVNGLAKSAKLYNSKKLNTSYLTFDLSNEITKNELDFKGTLPDEGTLIINEDGEISISAKKGKYCAYKKFDNIEITVETCTELDNTKALN